ncbi:MAG: TIGR03545 family protein [Planctomycetaceae bacterium]|nr:TIGR03545 family protein [Planctomycetaceae bacterium]
MRNQNTNQSMKSCAETAHQQAEQDRKNSQLRCGPVEISIGQGSALSHALPASKKVSRVRWGYLLPRFTLLAIFWAVLTFGLNPMLRFGLTTGAGASLGTTVGIDKLKNDLFSASLKIERIQVADRDTAGENAIEIDLVEIELDRNALLRKKFVVNRASITGISWNTDSTLSLSKEKSEKQNSPWSIPLQMGASQLADAGKQSGANFVEGLLTQILSPYNPKDFETVQMADLKEEQWKKRFADYRDFAEQTKQRVNALKRKIELSKKGNPLDNLGRFAQIAREVDELTVQGVQLKTEFSQLTNIARSDLAQLDAAKTRDFNKLRTEIASLPVNPEQLTQTILGPEIRRQFGQVTQWVQFIQQCANVASQDYEPVRGYGRTISFNQADRLPSFLIREFHVSGVASSQGQPIPFSGVLKNVTHAPKQYGKPMEYQIQLSHHGSAVLNGVIDLTGDVPRCTMNCKIESLEFPVQNIADHEKIQLALVTEKMQGIVQVTLVGDTIDATITWNQSDVHFLVNGDLELDQPELSKLGFEPISPVALLKRSLNGIDKIHGEVRIQGTIGSPSIELHSSIGEIIASRLQEEFRAEAQLRADEARLIAKKQITQRMEKLNTMMNREYRAALADLKINESLVQTLVDKVAVRPASGVLNRLFR